MTAVKLCGLSRERDIEAANDLRPEYIGFVLARGSRRYVSPDRAAALRGLLAPGITAVGVFVNEEPKVVAQLLEAGIIDAAQLHGDEDEVYIGRLRELTDRPLIQAFRIGSLKDAERAAGSSADHILLDSGAGTGEAFDWSLIESIDREYFLAGGLSPENVHDAVRRLHPYAVDVSSGIETDGYKDRKKMEDFVRNVRKEGVV